MCVCVCVCVCSCMFMHIYLLSSYFQVFQSPYQLFGDFIKSTNYKCHFMIHSFFLILFICLSLSISVCLYACLSVCLSLSLYLSLYICVYFPSIRQKSESKSNLKQSLTDLNSEFFFSKISWHTKVNDPCLSYYLPRAGRREVGFQRVLALCEMQTLFSVDWSRVSESSFDNNGHYCCYVLDCDISVNELELQLNCYVHLRSNTLGESMNPFHLNTGYCNIMAEGFRFMPLGLVRLRTFRLSPWIT